jgi:purine-cytosine permease-like protein
MKRSGTVIFALSVIFTILALVLGGDFSLFLRLLSYYLIGFIAVLLVAFLNTRRELASSGGRDRLCLRFAQGLASCAVCIGLLVTVIGLVYTIGCILPLRPGIAGVGNIAVSLLPLLYCLTIAEVVCPVLCSHFGCRVERANQAKSKASSNSAS